MKNSSKTILENIQQQNLRPKPRWYFVLQEIALWLGTVLSALLASFAIGSFILHAANMSTLPFADSVWFVILRIFIIITFVLLAVFHVTRTKRGYRNSWQCYIGFLLVLAVLAGTTFFVSRVTGQLDARLGKFGVVQQSRDYWTQPDKGLLAGSLIEVTDENYFLVSDLHNNTHIIDTQFVSSEEQEVFIDYARVQMVGYIDNEIFYPCAVRPWELRGRGHERNNNIVLYDGNRRFGKGDQSFVDNFEIEFERKNDILRSNTCR